jgi:hypothetical protein
VVVFLAFTIKVTAANPDYIHHAGIGDYEYIINSDTSDSEVAILL